MSKCLECKHAFLDNIERVAIRVSGKDQVFECLITSTTPCVDYSENILHRDLTCYAFEPCTESL